MENNENNQNKIDNNEKRKKKPLIKKGGLHHSLKNNKIFDFQDSEYKSILYSDIKFDNVNDNKHIKRSTIMPCLPSNDIYQNILKFNKIKIKSIKESNINQWKAILYNHNRIFSITQLNENIYYNDDSKIFTNDENQFNDFDEMDIISKDSIRTRCLETRLIKDFIKNLEALLRFFVKENKLQYKQGLNEIAGAFLLLKYSNVKLMTFSEVYNLLNGFFHLFVFNYYDDKTIYSIKNSLSLMQLLLKYHSPEIYNCFEKSMLSPEIYGTSWILTAFSYKLNLNKLFYLWNKLILENDQLMIHYFIVSLLIYKKNSFINLDEYSLPLALSRLNINSEKEIDIVFNDALNLRKLTPYSFRLFAFKLDLLKHKSNQYKLKYDFYRPDILVSIPIFPSEICFMCYNNIIKCPDENHIFTKNFNCEHCSMGIIKEIQYILLDIRINDSNNSKNGILQNINIIDKKEIKDENILNIIQDKFINSKNSKHLFFINSKSGNIFDFDSNFNINQGNLKRTKSIKDDKIEEIKNNKKLSKRDKNYEKEDYLLKKILLFLIQNNYKYVSYAYGGYEAIHNEIMNNKNDTYSKIKILNHFEEKCEICKKNRKALKHKSSKSPEESSNKIEDSLKNSIEFKKQINKQETNNIEKNYKTITINEVNKMISSTNYFAGPCSFVSDKKIDIESNNIQGLLIIYEKKLFCIKTPIQINKPMQIIQEILLINVKEIKMKDKMFCYFKFKNDKQIIENIIIKFNSEFDSGKFVESFNKAQKNE